MVGLKIGLDIGTGNITAAVEGKGIVLCEPAAIALERETGEVLETGHKALEMTGRCPDAIKLVKPILSGGVSELENTEKLLRVFLERICKNKIFKPTVVATMPAGITNLEKRNILGCVLRAGAGRATLIEEPLAAALGILGFGLGANAAIFMKIVLSNLAPDVAGSGTGIYGLFRDLAAPFGVAVFVPMFTNEISRLSTTGINTAYAAVNSMHMLAFIELGCVALAIVIVQLLPKIYNK